jgi:hypothetical protein
MSTSVCAPVATLPPVRWTSSCHCYWRQGVGSSKLVNTLLQLVQLPPGPTITEHMQRTKCPYQGGQLRGKAPTGDSHKAVKLMHPLVAAAAGGHLEVCEVLLAAGVGADAVASAARKAAEGGHLAVWVLLVLREITHWGPPCHSLSSFDSLPWDGHLPTLGYWLDAALLHSEPHSNRTAPSAAAWSLLQGLL